MKCYRCYVKLYGSYGRYNSVKKRQWLVNSDQWSGLGVLDREAWLWDEGIGDLFPSALLRKSAALETTSGGRTFVRFGERIP